ncbi:MAG: hypothetical protein QOE01_2171 [Actinomycetota bacterium]|jgi:Spy/CpxP family protein refolding chaperone|nr:hypothetical protein [Actinomycetota bacterium]
MDQVRSARTTIVALLLALGLALAVMAALGTSVLGGHNQAGTSWHKSTVVAGTSWHTAGTSWH